MWVFVLVLGFCKIFNVFLKCFIKKYCKLGISEKSSLLVLGVMILVWGCLMVMFKSMGKMLGLGLILLLSFNFLKVNYFLKVNFCFCKVIKRVIGKLK